MPNARPRPDRALPTRRRGALRGASTVEYVVALGMIGLVAAAGVRRFSTALNDKVQAQAECVEALGGCAGGATIATAGEGGPARLARLATPMALPAAKPEAAADVAAEDAAPGNGALTPEAAEAAASSLPAMYESDYLGNLVLDLEARDLLTPGDVASVEARLHDLAVGVLTSPDAWVVGSTFVGPVETDAGIVYVTIDLDADGRIAQMYLPDDYFVASWRCHATGDCAERDAADAQAEATMATVAIPFDFARGFLEEGVSTVVTLGELALSSTPPGRIVAALGGPDPLGDTANGLWTLLTTPVDVLVPAIAGQVEEAWQDNPAEFLGHVTFFVATFFVGGEAGDAADADRLVDVAEEAARVADVAADSALVVEVGDEAAAAARTADEIAAVGSSVDDAAELARAGRRFLLSRAGFEPSAEYARLAETAVREATAGIRSGRFSSLREALDFLAAERADIAVALGQDGAAQFGLARTLDAYTPFGGKYAYARDLAAPIVDSNGVALITAEIDGESVAMTLITRDRWWHTSPENIEKILRHCDALYARALDPALSTEETIRTVGELHYYLAHAMPYNRGSAAITDMLTKSIFDARGIVTPPWGQGVVPDIVALVTPDAATFADGYAGMFESPPTLVRAP